MAFWRWKLHWQILLGLVLGGLLGYLTAAWALSSAKAAGDVTAAGDIVVGRFDFMIYKLIGDMFLNALKLIIVPLVTSSIVLAVATLAAKGGFRRLGVKTLFYYLCTSTLAILIGLTLINLMDPGFSSDGSGILVGQDLGAFAEEAEQLEEKTGGKTASDFLDVFREMIPPNLFGAAVGGNLLGLIVASMVAGYFLTRLAGDLGSLLQRVVKAIYELSLAVTDLVLKFAPIGVGMLVAATVAEQYARLGPEDRFNEFFGGIVLFSLTTLAALILHFVVVMSLILLFIARVNPLRHYKAMAPALMTAFSTASSSATLPVTIECVEERAGVSNKTASFVLPLGATVNMDGTALYECVAAIFVCQALGIDLTFGQQFMVVVVALLTSVGVAGVPSASLVAIVVILQQVQNQLGGGMDLVAALPILLVFDRPLDMCRTAVNIFSDSVGAVTIARTEGETGLLTTEEPPEPGEVGPKLD